MRQAARTGLATSSGTTSTTARQLNAAFDVRIDRRRARRHGYAPVRCSFGHNQRRRGREPEPEPEREPQQQREPREMDFDNELGERPSASADGVEASSAAWEQSRFAPFSLPLQSEQMEIWSVCDDSCDSEDDDGERCIPRDASADADAAWWEHLQSVYVITFIREGEEHAGYYAVRAEGENGEPVDIIVGFADHDDATRHCGLLLANFTDGELPAARVEAVAPLELVELCEYKSCHCSVQREGVLLMPPEQMVVEENVEAARSRLERLLDDSS